MAVIKIKIFVPEIANVLTLFDKIQVQRSAVGTPTFADAVFVTADAPTAPSLLATLEGPYPLLQGTNLKIKVDGGFEQTVTFTPVNPITLSNVITEFNTTITGATASDGGGVLLITGDNLGTDGTLELTGGSSLPILGLVSGAKSSGKDSHVALLAFVSNYEYDDQSGEASHWYRTRFYNQTSGTFSSWSDWTQGSTGAAVQSSYLIVGKIKLAELDGTALVGQKVTIVNIFNPLITDGYFIAGRHKVLETDGIGQAEVTLIMGSLVDVIVEGTSFIRRIQVPNVGTEFDLLDPLLVKDDAFGIQVPDLPAAVRRS